MQTTSLEYEILRMEAGASQPAEAVAERERLLDAYVGAGYRCNTSHVLACEDRWVQSVTPARSPVDDAIAADAGRRRARVLVREWLHATGPRPANTRQREDLQVLEQLRALIGAVLADTALDGSAPEIPPLYRRTRDLRSELFEILDRHRNEVGTVTNLGTADHHVLVGPGRPAATVPLPGPLLRARALVDRYWTEFDRIGTTTNQRGRALARTGVSELVLTPGLVRARVRATAGDRYLVELRWDGREPPRSPRTISPVCSCPDRRRWCKHAMAVAYHLAARG